MAARTTGPSSLEKSGANRYRTAWPNAPSTAANTTSASSITNSSGIMTSTARSMPPRTPRATIATVSTMNSDCQKISISGWARKALKLAPMRAGSPPAKPPVAASTTNASDQPATTL